MHGGIPWWLVLILEAIHFLPWIIGGLLALAGYGVWRWWRK